MIAALNSGRLAGAFLDVFAQEPLPKESPLWDMPSVICSPHTAGFSDSIIARVAQIFLDNLQRWHDRHPLVNIANPG
jgi:phosphoglycerate dehydrogenase-like enzyme